MRLRLLAIGSRGDVQPYVALGAGLRDAGFDVSIGTTGNFRELVESVGLTCIASDVDMQALAGQARGGGRAARWALFETLLTETRRLSEGADALVYSSAAILTAPHVAEKLGIPAIAALPQPYLHPTRAFPAVGMPALPLGGRYNSLTYAMFERFVWAFLRRRINAWRRDTLGLAPMAGPGPFTALRRQGTLTLYGFSEVVLPRPAEWGADAQITGYWFLPRDGWQPPEELAAFLEDGEPPVYLGFGSMVGPNSRLVTEVLLPAIRIAGVRAIIAAGWSSIAMSDLPRNVLLIKEAPHEWLFAHVAAAVHHGGAGTTGASLRAGVPTAVVPFGADQPFWGRRVAQLGAGPTPIPRARLTVLSLAEALRTICEDDGMRRRAQEIGQRIRAEDGVANAVRAVQGRLL